MKPSQVYAIADTRVERLARRYRVPAQVLAALRSSDVEQWARAARAAWDRQYLELELAAADKVRLLGQPVAVGAETAGDKVVIRVQFKSATVHIPVARDRYASRSPEEWYRALTDWIAVEASRRPARRGSVLVAERWQPVQARVDMETARALVESRRRVGLDAPLLRSWLHALGYSVNCLYANDTPWLYSALARLTALISPEPVHVLELTRPGTAKTTWGLTYTTALRWRYYNEPPSLASLVGDARSGRSIIAAVDGLWMDEFDKWTASGDKRSDVAELIEVLLTGMEQGYWRRSKGGDKQIEVYNAIPVIYTGNIQYATEPREWLRDKVDAIESTAGAAFEERIGIALAIAEPVDAFIKCNWTQLKGRTIAPRPSLLRGLLELSRDMAAAAPAPADNPFSGRYARHYTRVYRALYALLEPIHDQEGRDVTVERVAGLARDMVQGVSVGSRRQAGGLALHG